MKEPSLKSIEVVDAFVYVKRDAVADSRGVGGIARGGTLVLLHCKQSSQRSQLIASLLIVK